MSTFNIENVKPVENVPAPVEVGKLTVAPVAVVEPVLPVEEITPSVAQPESEVAESEEDGDYEYESESEEEMMEDEVDDETFGEQAVEVAGPLSIEEEANEALQLASSFGLESTDAALDKISGKNQRVNFTLNRYSEMINQDQEAVSFYDNISSEIEVLRTALNAGLNKMVTDSEITSDSSAIDAMRTLMESYLRTVLTRSMVHCEYREASALTTQDVLQALNLMGRPLYWQSPAASTTTTSTSTEEASMDIEEDAAMDEDDEDEEDGAWQADEDVAEDDLSAFEASMFKRVVNVINTFDVQMEDECYKVLSATVDHFLMNMIQGAAKAALYVGHPEIIKAEDVFFSQQMSSHRF